MATVEEGATDQASWRALRLTGAMGQFLLLCLGVWLHAADSLVTATLVPSIVYEVGGIAYVGWTISLYQIGAIVAGAATAVLCQRIGVRRVFCIAALVYGLGCVIAALAPAMAPVLLARFVQGAGGGMLISLSYVAIQQSFPEHLWSRLFGIEAAVWAAGSLLGPMIGGLFANFGLWRGAFWFFAIQAGLLWVLVLVLFPERKVHSGPRQAWPLLPLVFLTAATLLIAQAGVIDRAAMSVLACLAGLVLLYFAAKLDGRGGSRLFPARLLDLQGPIGSGLAMIFAFSLATTGFWTYGPLILRIMFGIEPLVSGYMLAGEALAWSFATLLVSAAPLSAGRTLIRLGAGLVAVGAAGFTITVPAGSLIGMVVCALLQGLGFGFFWPSAMQRIVSFADPDEQALAAAAPGTVQRIGYAVGAAAVGIAANMSGLAEGASVATAAMAGFWVFAGFIPVLLFGLVAAWSFTRARPAREIDLTRAETSA